MGGGVCSVSTADFRVTTFFHHTHTHTSRAHTRTHARTHARTHHTSQVRRRHFKTLEASAAAATRGGPPLPDIDLREEGSQEGPHGPRTPPTTPPRDRVSTGGSSSSSSSSRGGGGARRGGGGGGGFGRDAIPPGSPKSPCGGHKGYAKLPIEVITC